MHYFNTTQLTGEDLKQAVTDAKDQEEAIYIIYKTTDKPFTPSSILGMMERAGHRLPITSVRRAITNLTDRKLLVMLPNMKTGPYNRPEHYWRINKTL